MILHDATLRTIVHGTSLFHLAPLPPLRHRDFPVVDALATKCCSYLGTAVTRRYATYTFFDVALLYFLNLDSSIQVWFCTLLRVWTKDPW